MAKITFEDKVALNVNSDIADVNKKQKNRLNVKCVNHLPIKR